MERNPQIQRNERCGKLLGKPFHRKSFMTDVHASSAALLSSNFPSPMSSALSHTYIPVHGSHGQPESFRRKYVLVLSWTRSVLLVFHCYWPLLRSSIVLYIVATFDAFSSCRHPGTAHEADMSCVYQVARKSARALNVPVRKYSQVCLWFFVSFPALFPHVRALQSLATFDTFL